MHNSTADIEKILQTLHRDPGSYPTAAFRTNARIRILNRIAKNPTPVRSPAHYPSRAIYALRLAVLVLFFAGGTVYAAQSSLPKDALFPVKVLSERVALTLSPTQTIKTTVANTIIRRRAMEIEATKQDGNTEEVRQTIKQYESTVTEIRSNTHVSHDEIEREVSKHESLLKESNTRESRDEHQQSSPNNESSQPKPTPSPKPNDPDKPKESSSVVPLPLPSSKELLDHKDSEL